MSGGAEAPPYFTPTPNWLPTRATLWPSNTTSSSFSLPTARPVSSVRTATRFFVFTSKTSPVDGYARRPSMLNEIQPG